MHPIRDSPHTLLMEYCVKAVEEGFLKIADRYELHTETLEDLKNIVLASLRQYSTQINGAAKAPKVVKAPGSGAVQKRKRNGYNCYIKYRFEQAKLEGGEDYKSQQQMAEFSRSWADLPEDEKKKFQKMAEDYNKENGADIRHKKGRGGKRRVTGYNIFYRDNVERIKQELKESNEDTTTMKAVGREWHALGTEGQELWRKKARDEENEQPPEEEED